MDYERKISNIVYIMRVIAILSVICAHITIKSESKVLIYIKHVFDNFGSIGVGVFLFCSGMYYSYKEPFIKFFKKNVLCILPSHIIASSLIYLTLSAYHHDFMLANMVNFIIGNGSIFYFLTDMYLIKIISYFLLNNLESRFHNLLFFIVFLLNATFILLENHSVSIFPTPYLDIFIFIFYFYLGIFVRKNILVLYDIIDGKKYNAIIWGLQFFMFIILSKYKFSYYKNCFSLIFEILFIISTMCIAYNLSHINVEYIGKNTLFIYLYHLFPIIAINNIGNKYHIIQIFVVLWPILVLIIMLIALYCINKIFKPRIKRIVFGIK